MSKRLLLCVVCSATLFCFFSPATAHHPASVTSGGGPGGGPVHTIPAATIPAGAFNASLTTHYTEFDCFSDNELETLAGQHIHGHSADWALATILGFSYGIADDITLNISLPYTRTENIRAGHHHHAGGAAINNAESHGDVSGFGDISALATIKVLDREQGPDAAALLGLKASTGNTDREHNGALRDAEHQPGSGSWDTMMGAAVSGKAGNAALDANILYTLVTEGTQDTDLGDRLNYNIATTYRIGGEVHDHGDYTHRHEAWDLVLELNGEWSDYQKTAGVDDKDTGGHIIYLSPGVRFSPNDQWSLHFSVGVPVIDSPETSHPKRATGSRPG